MKKFRQKLSVLLAICMLMTMMPASALANEVTVASVTAQLEAIDTLQEMQNARKNFKASGTYSDATAENHELKRAGYEQYLADMQTARQEAAEAYAALSGEEKASIEPELVEKLDNNLNTVWNEVSDTVSAGVGDYQYQAVYPGYAYELSNHMVSKDGGVHNEIPQTLVLVDTAKNAGEWTPNGQYSFGASNYEVVYCSDAEYGVVDGTLYQRVNLEDSTYYDAKAAEHIRAIVSNSYPYLSLEQMKANLIEVKFEHAEDLTRSDIIAAVQLAIWNYSNGAEASGADYQYSRTFDLNANTQWGRGFHDYTNELWDWWSVGKRHLTVNNEAGERVNKLAKYLTELEGEKANTSQIVINDVKIESAQPVQAKKDTYNVALKVLLNNGATSEQDNIVMTVKTDSQTITEAVELGTAEYDMVIEAKAGETISVLVEGKQTLPKGAYLYMPQPADTDGDGVTTSREASQTLVGVAEGLTVIEATDSVTLDIPETNLVTTNLKLQKTDEKGAALTGTGFDLYFLGEEASYRIGTYPVDENGVLVVEGLLPGNYELVESVVTEGYRNPEKPIAFSVDEEGVLILEDSVYAELVDGVVVVKNYPTSFTELGSLSIKKVDSVSKEALEGAAFTLKGKGFEKTLTTGKDGTLLFSGLAFGEYTLTETEAPAGYVKDTTEWPIKIGIGEGEKLEWVQEVANTPVGSLEITKTDIDTGETLEGAEFRLTNQEGNVVGILTTEENGKVTFKNLPYGDYKLEETKAPAGYVLNKESKIIKIVDNDEIEKCEYANKAITGSVKVVKQDGDGKLLAGAEFTLTQGDETIAKATTNAEGIVEFTGLSYGVEYKVTETKAPEGYLLNKEATDTFTILEDGQKEEFTYENTRENSSENPSLAVEKTADKTQYLPGETVTYTINVTNDGNVDLDGITLDDVFSKNDVVADHQLTVEGYEGAFDLAIDETASFTSKFVIPENDPADTTYKNVVTVTTGDTAAEAEETIVVDPTYAFTIEKTADKTEVTVGDTVTYTIVVTNTGNKALTNVDVKDNMIGLDTVIDQLAVHESKTLTGEYVVTADDIGELENIATATVEVDGEPITHEASVIVNVSAKAETVVDELPNIFGQNPLTGDTTINPLLLLFVFVLAGSGLYVYRRKHKG